MLFFQTHKVDTETLTLEFRIYTDNPVDAILVFDRASLPLYLTTKLFDNCLFMSSAK